MNFIEKTVLSLMPSGKNLLNAALFLDVANRIGGSEKRLKDIRPGLERLSKQLTAKDVQEWRKAEQFALNFENPQRHYLYAHYYDTLKDAHVKACVRNRKLQTLRRKFQLVNEAGEQNPETTKMLKTKWFRQFISYSLDALFWGHSLIGFESLIDGQFCEVYLVPRDHVIPDLGIVTENVGDDKGIIYRKAFKNVSIEVWDKDSFGLLSEATPHAIGKRNVQTFWDEFSEVFGMPLRIAKTAQTDVKELNKLENFLSNMGRMGWGLFPEGTEIELKESTNKDAYQVYDKRIDRANTEISKLITGVTMTMEDGSSRSQSEVHERVAEDIVMADGDWLAEIINNDLLPFLILHGYPVAGLEFTWDDSKELTLQENIEIDKFLLEHFDIETEHFIQRYGRPITGVKQVLNTSGDGGNTEKK